jgi:hypothetical protein
VALFVSKSLDFCVSTASSPEGSFIYDYRWDNAKELDAEHIFDQYIEKERNFMVTGTASNGERFRSNVILEFNPDADFQYFTSLSCIHDGSLAHLVSLLEKCVSRVCCLGTFYKPLGEPHNGMTVHIVVGNFVVLNEYDKEGDSFAPEDKKWMCERTTVLLPLRMEYVE